MISAGDDELRALRTRAYGRDPDIHLDPDALDRLRELEELRVAAELQPILVDEVIEVAPEPTVHDSPAVDDAPRSPPAWLLLVGRWARGLRRSTILIVVGVAALAATLGTVLTLVQRVQTDPLQLGATQIARLSVDSGYEIPTVFAGSDPDRDVQAYQPFHGLRVVMNSSAFAYAASADSRCMAIYPEANITTTANSFSGPLFGGCSAGNFPPMIQFTADIEDLPDELASALPESSGLQFVYDAEHDEIVVFSDR